MEKKTKKAKIIDILFIIVVVMCFCVTSLLLYRNICYDKVIVSGTSKEEMIIPFVDKKPTKAVEETIKAAKRGTLYLIAKVLTAFIFCILAKYVSYLFISPHLFSCFLLHCYNSWRSYHFIITTWCCNCICIVTRYTCINKTFYS